MPICAILLKVKVIKCYHFGLEVKRIGVRGRLLWTGKQSGFETEERRPKTKKKKKQDKERRKKMEHKRKKTAGKR